MFIKEKNGITFKKLEECIFWINEDRPFSERGFRPVNAPTRWRSQFSVEFMSAVLGRNLELDLNDKVLIDMVALIRGLLHGLFGDPTDEGDAYKVSFCYDFEARKEDKIVYFSISDWKIVAITFRMKYTNAGDEYLAEVRKAFFELLREASPAEFDAEFYYEEDPIVRYGFKFGHPWHHAVEDDSSLFLFGVDGENDLIIRVISPDVTEIDLSCEDFVVVDLSPLSQCHGLKVLDLSENFLEFVDLTPLQHCSKLEKLFLASCRLQELDLSPLASCHALKTLLLCENELVAVDLSPLASCKQLQLLDVSHDCLKELDLSPLTGHEGLHYLVSHDNYETNAVFFGDNPLVRLILPELPHVREIHVNGFDSLEELDLSPLQHCSSFPFVDISDNGIKVLDLSSLGAIQGLRVITTHVDVDYYFLAEDDGHGTCLIAENPLEEVILPANAQLERVILDHLSLKILDLTSLEASKNLKELSIVGNNLMEINLQPLRSCTSLEILNMSENQLFDIDLDPLCHLQSLTRLDRSFNLLQRVNLTPLAPLVT